MFKFLIITAVVSLACGAFAVDSNDAQAYILKQNSNIDEVGNYHYNYETSNGITVQEKGVGGHWATGGYGYYSPEGELIQLTYLADDNGFQPSGSHIPIPPPIPQAILRSLEYNRNHPNFEK